MPLPTPHTGEDQSAFVSRFMADKEAVKSFPDQKQRSAVAYEKWRDRAKGAAAVAAAAVTAADDLMNPASADPASTSGYQINQDALERLKALVRAGKWLDKPWSFSAEDSNELLGTPPNWTDYGKWNLGIDHAADKETKAAYGYPYGKAGSVYLFALRDIASRAGQQGLGQIADAASAVLADAQQKIEDKVQAGADGGSATFKVGDRVKVRPGKNHDAMTKDATGTVEIVSSSALGVQFEGMKKVHKWYVADELEDADDKATAAEWTTPVMIVAADMSGANAVAPAFTMDAYTGGPMVLKGWRYPVVVDLDGVDATDKSRPILRDHDSTKPLGHTTDITVAGGKIAVSGIISGEGEHVSEVVASSKKGFPWQASIGAKVITNQFVPEGHSAEANGRTWKGPINIARRTSLREISFLALGADDDTTAKIAAEAAERHAMKFKAWMKAAGLKADGMDDDTMKGCKATFKAAYPKEDPDDDCEDEKDGGDDEEKEKKAKAKAKADAAAAALDIAAGDPKDGKDDEPFDPKKAAKEASKEFRKNIMAERKRVKEIEAVLDKYKPRVDAKKYADIEASALGDDSEEWNADRVELSLLRIARPDGTGVRTGIGNAGAFGINTGKGGEVTGDIIAAACAATAGVGEKAAFFGLPDNAKEIASSKKVRNGVSSIYGLCSIIAAAHGVIMPSPRMDDEVVKTMFRLDRRLEAMDIQAAGDVGGFSTMSLAGITENILNKAMLEAYGLVGSIIPDIAWETDTPDFKQFKRYRMTASGILAALGAAGELKSISLQDESYSNQVKTQGVILNIGRDVLINDDMGALTQAPTTLGRGAALYREMIAIGTLLGGTVTTAPGASIGQTANNFNFFSTGANNYLTGAGSVLQISSLTTAVQKFREQVDANSMPIMLNPDRLLVPPALEVVSKNLFNGANLVVGALGSTSAKSVEPDINAHKGAYRPIVSPFLANSVGKAIAKFAKSDPAGQAFGNYPASDTAWYLLTNPSGGFAPIQIGYLRGQRVPIIERGESNFNTLGIAMRCYYDFGVALHDYRCAVESAGA